MLKAGSAVCFPANGCGVNVRHPGSKGRECRGNSDQNGGNDTRVIEEAPFAFRAGTLWAAQYMDANENKCS